MKQVSIPFSITLESETLIGSGYGYGVVIDSDVVYDDDGFPYIPGKRIKGLLRDSAEELADILQLTDKSTLIRELFGTKGSDESAKVYFSDFALQNVTATKQQLSYFSQKYAGFINPETVIDSFTSIRRQTAIDQEKGIARDTSLRTLRVLKSGIVFTGEISALDIQDRSLELLHLAIIGLRRIGTRRNKGLGEVSTKLNNNKHKDYVGGAQLLTGKEVQG